MSKKPPVTFAQALIQSRKELGLTKTALGRRLGVSLQTIMRWELGKFMPDRADRWRVIAALDGVSEPLEDVLRATLGVPRPATAPVPIVAYVPSAATDERMAHFVIDAAVLAMAERLPGAPVAELRSVLAAVLETLARGELDVVRALDVTRVAAGPSRLRAAPPGVSSSA